MLCRIGSMLVMTVWWRKTGIVQRMMDTRKKRKMMLCMANRCVIARKVPMMLRQIF